MKSIFKAMALSLGMAAVLSFASCSNGSSSEDLTEELQGNEGTVKITGKTVVFTSDEDYGITVTAEELADYNIDTMTISAKLYETSSSVDNWWTGIPYSNGQWLSLTWTDSPSITGYSYEGAADESLISSAKTDGICIKGQAGLTVEVIITITCKTENAENQSEITDETTETDDAEITEASKILFNKDVSGNSVTELLSETALDSYTEGTITVSGEWVSGSSTPGICIDGDWNTNLWNSTTNSNSQSFSVSEIKGKSLGINMYSDDTTYTITVTYSAE